MLAGPASAALKGQAKDDIVGRAMHDELARSMEQLHLAQLERPYFISYTLHDQESVNISASNGSLLGLDSNRARMLSVEMRVGDYKFDNTNFVSMPSFSLGDNYEEYSRGLQLPLEDNYLELRRQIWLATDASYKRAAAALASKRAALLNQSRSDSLPDFTHVPVSHMVDEGPVAPVAVADLESLVRDASMATDLPGIYTSSATVTVSTPRTRYLNSEGTSYSRVRSSVMLSARAATQADDGMPLGGTVRFRAQSVDGLPPRAQIVAQVRAMCLRLDSLRHAPMVDRYNGPVLFDGRAAGELLSEVFAPALVGRRKMTMASTEMGMAFDRMSEMTVGGSFADKLGGRVLPEFLNVVDDPTNGSLVGYKVDEEGVAAHATDVVDGGILKTLLTTRTPVQGVDHSTGNRRGGMAVPSNLIVRASNGSSGEELVAQLLAMVKKRGLSYGIIVREVGDATSAAAQEEAAAMMQQMMGRGGPQRGVRLVYRVYPDGHEEMVRGAQFSGLTVDTFKDIVAASKTTTLYYHAASEIQAGFGAMAAFMVGGGAPFGGTPLSSYTVPSLLFDDLTLTRSTRALPALPFSSPPGNGR